MRALPRGGELCLGCIFICSAECFIQKASHLGQPLFHGSAGWCAFLKKLLATSPQLARKTTGHCFVTFLQGKHRQGQGQTTQEGSWAFVQGLQGVTCTSERRPGKQAHSPVFWHHQNSPSLFCGCGPSPGKLKAWLLSFSGVHEPIELWSVTHQERLCWLLNGF